MNESSARPSAAVLISGGGSNLQSIIDACESGQIAMQVGVVVSNNPDARGLDRARNANIPVECVDHRNFDDRQSFDAALVATIDQYSPSLVVLAGFMRILTAEFVAHFAGRILNIHPSLLPAYPGLGTHQRAIDNGDEWHGCTVHFVTEDLDAGPPVMQARVPILADDDAESLAARVLQFEHRIYPLAADLIASGRVRYANSAAAFDGKQLEQPLQYPECVDELRTVRRFL